MAPTATSRRRSRLKAAALGGAVLAVLAGSLLWLFWTSVYEFSINPQRPFLTARQPAAPDYADPQAWAALPGRMDSADLTPQGLESAAAEAPAADVFFLHPTTMADDGRWNINWRYRPARQVNRVAMPNLASAFAEGTRFYAPRYRQATQYAFHTRSEDSRLAQRFAYEDVRRAFGHYLTHWNRGRPFILAGAGQGGLHAAGLLQEFVAGTELRRRLIAAYIVGAAIPADLFGNGGPLRALRPCTSPDATGCVAVWAAFPWDAGTRRFSDEALIWQNMELRPVGDRSLLCVNPLSWRMDDAPVLQDNNRGSLPIGRPRGVRLARLVPAAAGAHCVDGVLRVDLPADRRLRRDLLPGRPHNLLDVALFYDSIRTNVQTRAAAFLHDRGAGPVTGALDRRE